MLEWENYLFFGLAVGDRVARRKGEQYIVVSRSRHHKTNSVLATVLRVQLPLRVLQLRRSRMILIYKTPLTTLPKAGKIRQVA